MHAMRVFLFTNNTPENYTIQYTNIQYLDIQYNTQKYDVLFLSTVDNYISANEFLLGPIMSSS